VLIYIIKKVKKEIQKLANIDLTHTKCMSTCDTKKNENNIGGCYLKHSLLLLLFWKG